MPAILYAAIYVRISSDRESQQCGVVRQEEHCRELARRLGFTVFRVYKDNDRGASKYSTKQRKDYEQLLKDARAGQFQVILAYSSGRLTRRPLEHEGQITLAEDFGIKYYFTNSPSFDLNTAHGRQVARILAATDAAEAEEISERVSDDKKTKAKEGRYLGGYRAYGYEGARYEDGNLINKGRINVALVEDEVEIYRSCVRRIIAGEKAMTIIRDLNERGIPSPDGKKWVVGNFKRILTKERYVIFDDTDPDRRGTLVHQGNKYQAIWPGIITRDEYELMMIRFTETAQHWDHGLVRGRTYLLSGFIFCGVCGKQCIGSRRASKEGHLRRYRCKSRDQHGMPYGCGKVFRAADPLEDYVTEEVLAKFDTPEVLKALVSTSSDQAKVSSLVMKLENLRARRRELVKEYGRGEHTKADYQLMLTASDEAIEEVQTDLAKLHDEQAASLLPSNQPVRLVWETASIEWKRAVIWLIVERVEILPGKPGSRAYKDWRFNTDFIRIIWRHLSVDAISSELTFLLSALEH